MLRIDKVSMLGFGLRLTAVLMTLCVLPVLVIQAQTYHDDALRAFLTPPEGCPAPCFMGIRPGVTTFERAAGILRAHAWIDQTSETQRYRNRWAYLFWTWNGTQPFLPRGGYDNSLSTDIEVSGDLSIQTTITPVEIWWLYGPPRWMHHLRSVDGDQYLFGYPDHKLLVMVEVRSCATLVDVLTTPSRLTFARWIFNKPERFPEDYVIDLDLTTFRNVNPCRRAV
jgi:hypothetical protein